MFILFLLFAEIEKLDIEFKAISLPNGIDMEQLSSVVQLRKAVEDLEREKWQLAMKFKHVGPFLQPGRILRVSALLLVLNASITFILYVSLSMRRRSAQ